MSNDKKPKKAKPAVVHGAAPAATGAGPASQPSCFSTVIS